ncbi:hypothetical protein Hdeb2414_s0004g00123041 [Helianthus debilis subsp. tardiflorus]
MFRHLPLRGCLFFLQTSSRELMSACAQTLPLKTVCFFLLKRSENDFFQLKKKLYIPFFKHLHIKPSSLILVLNSKTQIKIPKQHLKHNPPTYFCKSVIGRDKAAGESPLAEEGIMRKFDPWPVFFKREFNRNWPFLVGFAITGTIISKFSLGLTGASSEFLPGQWVRMCASW